VGLAASRAHEAIVLRSGLVLLGGASSRMGRMKALLDFGGEPLLMRVARRLAPLVDELLLVASPPDQLSDATRAALDGVVTCLESEHLGPRGPAGADRSARPPLPVRLVHDRLAFHGPVSGLATGLDAARGELAVAVACDAPFLVPELIDHLFLVATESAADVVVPACAGLLEPLCAVYRTHTMSAELAAQLERGDLKPSARFHAVRTRTLDEAEWRTFDPDGLSFVNLNQPADYDAALRRVGVP
jgi:molybdopterin-guanine dinucleotide biosynthesis protein A